MGAKRLSLASVQGFLPSLFIFNFTMKGPAQYYGGVTVAVDKKTGEASFSICCPSDRFNPRKGLLAAAGRLQKWRGKEKIGKVFQLLVGPDTTVKEARQRAHYLAEILCQREKEAFEKHGIHKQSRWDLFINLDP